MAPDLTSWESELSASVPTGMEALNALRPQKNFRYPPFPAYEIPDAEEVFRRFALLRAPQAVRLYPGLRQALEATFAQPALKGKRIATSLPAPPEFLRAIEGNGCRLEVLPRDPELWLETSLEGCDAVYFSQPNRVDGFYYPDEFFEEITARLARRRPDLWILSEESNSLFTLNETPPGHLKLFKSEGHRKRVVIRAMEPVLLPQGPDLAWTCGPLTPEEGFDRPALAEALDPATVRTAARCLMSFQMRQGAAYGEFQRKILLLEKGLRWFSDSLKPLLNDKLFLIPIWPESGFHLLLDVRGALNARAFGPEAADSVGAARWLAREHGILTWPGDFCASPGSLGICFAGTPKWLERLAQAFVAALQKNPS